MASKAPTLIAAGTVVSGRIDGAEDVDLHGRLEGALSIEGTLRIDEAARADADLEVSRLEIRGILVGNASASEAIELFGSARVIGDLVAPKIVVREGAKFRGLIDMGEAPEAAIAPPGRRPVVARRPAPPSRPVRKPAPAPAPAAEDDADS